MWTVYGLKCKFRVDCLHDCVEKIKRKLGKNSADFKITIISPSNEVWVISKYEEVSVKNCKRLQF